MIMINNKKISKIFRIMSLFLIFTMIIGFLHPENILAKEKFYVFKEIGNGYSVVIKKIKKNSFRYGIADSDNNVVLPIEYDRIDDESDNLLEVKKGKKYGFVDKEGKIVIPVEYENAFDFCEDLAPVKKEGKWGFINKNNEMVIPFKYDDASCFQDDFAVVNKEGKYGIINKKV